MKIRIMGSIVHPVEKPKKYFGMLDIYTDKPPLFIPFSFTVMDNKELCPHILFFDQNANLFLDADSRTAPEDMKLKPEQLNMYQILTTSVLFGIFNMLGRQLHGFSRVLLIHSNPKRRRNKKPQPQENIVVPFMVDVINLDEKQTETITKIGSGFNYNDNDN